MSLVANNCFELWCIVISLAIIPHIATSPFILTQNLISQNNDSIIIGMIKHLITELHL